MSIYLGDRVLGQTLGFWFPTSVNGVLTDMTGTPTVDVYKRSSSTPIVTGVSVQQTYNGIVGLNFVTFAMGAGYVDSQDYGVVISAGSLDGIPQIGRPVAHFSINQGNALALNGSSVASGFAAATTDLAALAANMAKAVATMPFGTAASSSTTTVVKTSALTLANATNADQFKEATIVFLSNTTSTQLRGVRRTITASTQSATPDLTVDALPQAPVSGDTFMIV